MDRRTIEALAEAIAHVSGYTDPSSPLYRARNPGGLKPLSDRHQRDEHGNRVFRSVLDGMQALLFDLEIKLGGRLSPDSTLSDLAAAYGRQQAEAKAWARFLQKALSDDSISPRTAIKFFFEDKQ